MENKAYIIIKLQGKADEINEKYKNSTKYIDITYTKC